MNNISEKIDDSNSKKEDNVNTSSILSNNDEKDENKYEKDVSKEYILLQDSAPDKVIGDNFWFNDSKILFREDRLTEFYPSYDMTLIEKLNAIARLFIFVYIYYYTSIYYIYIQ